MTPRDAPALRGLRILGAVGAFVLFVSAFTPLANWLNRWMAGGERLERAGAIVVMGRGGADADGVLTNRSLRRSLHGIALYRKNLAPLVVFSGTPLEVASRGDLARGLGVPAAAILPAPGAHTTREEATLLAHLLQPHGIRRILLVADPIDMPRTRQFMRREGFEVLPAATASSGPDGPESRLWLVRDIGIELTAWAYNWIVGPR